jgi:hypothetical protein
MNPVRTIDSGKYPWAVLDFKDDCFDQINRQLGNNGLGLVHSDHRVVVVKAEHHLALGQKGLNLFKYHFGFYILGFQFFSDSLEPMGSKGYAGLVAGSINVFKKYPILSTMPSQLIK